jgi:hypothetical protein
MIIHKVFIVYLETRVSAYTGEIDQGFYSMYCGG